MKKFSILLLFILVCSFARADSYEYLVFHTSSGELSITAEGARITFEDGNLIASNGSETQTMALTDVSKFCFSHDTTGIEVLSFGDGAEEVDVYSAAGIFVGRCAYDAVSSLALPKGIYILKGEQTSKKFIVE